MNHAVLGAVEALQLLQRALERLVDGRVLDGQRHEIGQGAQQRLVALGKRTALLVHGAEHADHAGLGRQRHIQHAARPVAGIVVHPRKKEGALRGVVDDQRPAGPIDLAGHALVHGKAHLAHALAGVRIVENGYPEEEFLLLLVQKDHARALDVHELPHLPGDELQAGVQRPELIKRLGDPKESLADPAVALFMRHVPQGDDLAGRPAVLVVEKRAVDDDVEQAAVLGQPPGLEVVDDFFLVEPRQPGAGLGPALFRYERHDFALQLLETPAEHFLEGRVQIGYRAVQVEHEHRIGQELEKGAVALLRSAAGLGEFQGARLRVLQRFLRELLVGDVACDASESGLAALGIRDRRGGDLQETPFGIRAADLPGHLRDAASLPKDPVEGFVRDPGVFGVHELCVVPVLKGLTRMAENAAEGVVEELEIAVQVDLVEPVGHVLDQDAVTLLSNLGRVLAR